MEGQVGTPRFVHDQRHPPCVAERGDGSDVGAGAVGRRAGDQGAARVRVFVERSLVGLGAGRMSEAKVGVPPWFDPHRADARENQAGHHRFVRVPPHQQLLVRVGDGQHGCLHREGTAAGGEEGVFGAHRVSHQLFGPLQDALGHGPVVHTGQREHVRAEEGIPKHGSYPWIGAAPLLVAGRCERQLSLSLVRRQSVEYRRLRMVHRVASRGKCAKGWRGMSCPALRGSFCLLGRIAPG